MSDSFGLVVAIAAAWVSIGLVLSIVMGRRGHNTAGWLVLGTLVGPLAVVLAIDSERNEARLEPAPLPGGPRAPAGSGPVDLLVGFDGSPESAAALDAAMGLLGPRIGRLTVATVVPFGGVREQERRAGEELRRLEAGMPGRGVELEVLHGHPATALQDFAAAGGYELIVIGTRGTGITKAILGSAASELARGSDVPVLLVGGRRTVRRAA
jgi:nucleotide-binding universal stress UspA family protein